MGKVQTQEQTQEEEMTRLALLLLLLTGCASYPKPPMPPLPPVVPVPRVQRAIAPEAVTVPPELTNFLLKWNWVGSNAMFNIYTKNKLTNAWQLLTNVSTKSYSNTMGQTSARFFRVTAVVNGIESK